MKTHTTITELTHEDLVDLLCTATYSSSWLECYAPDREGLSIEDSDCREDVWAKALLAGKSIYAIDHYAEGEVYGDKGRVDADDEDESVIYPITLSDVRNGLESAINGTYRDEANTKTWARECAQHFIAGEGEMDLPEAECLMQIIMFGDVIY